MKRAEKRAQKSRDKSELKHTASAPPKNIRVSRPSGEIDAERPGSERAPRFSRLRASWKGAARIAGWSLFVAGLVAGSIALGRSFEEFVRSSPSFAIKLVQVEGNSQLNDEEILAAAGVALGENIFKYKSEEIEARLEKHPALREVSVERVLPSRFTIRVEEYRPVALLSLDGLYLLSREGVAYRALDAAEGYDLPIISLADPESLLDERPLRQRLLFEAASIIDTIDRHGGELLSELMEIHIRQDHRFVLRFFDERMDVFLGRGDYPSKLGRLREVLGELDERSLRASRVHIDNELQPERVTVKLRL